MGDCSPNWLENGNAPVQLDFDEDGTHEMEMSTTNTTAMSGVTNEREHEFAYAHVDDEQLEKARKHMEGILKQLATKTLKVSGADDHKDGLIDRAKRALQKLLDVQKQERTRIALLALHMDQRCSDLVRKTEWMPKRLKHLQQHVTNLKRDLNHARQGHNGIGHGKTGMSEVGEIPSPDDISSGDSAGPCHKHTQLVENGDDTEGFPSLEDFTPGEASVVWCTRQLDVIMQAIVECRDDDETLQSFVCRSISERELDELQDCLLRYCRESRRVKSFEKLYHTRSLSLKQMRFYIRAEEQLKQLSIHIEQSMLEESPDSSAQNTGHQSSKAPSLPYNAHTPVPDDGTVIPTKPSNDSTVVSRQSFVEILRRLFNFIPQDEVDHIIGKVEVFRRVLSPMSSCVSMESGTYFDTYDVLDVIMSTREELHQRLSRKAQTLYWLLDLSPVRGCELDARQVKPTLQTSFPHASDEEIDDVATKLVTKKFNLTQFEQICSNMTAALIYCMLPAAPKIFADLPNIVGFDFYRGHE